MSTGMKRFIYWTPRVLGILFALFLSLFALDVFEAGLTPGESLRAFLVHLFPVYVIVLVLALAWKWPLIGAILFPLLAAAYIIMAWGHFDWVAYAVISGPALLLGILFLLNWIYRAQLRAH